MRVLIVIGRDQDGADAASRYVRLLAEGLAAAGVDTTLLTYAPKREPAPRFPFKALTAGGRLSFWGRCARVLGLERGLARSARRELESSRYDAVIAYGETWTSTNQVVKAARASGTPCVASVTEIWFAGISPRRLVLDGWLFWRRVAPRLSGIIAISEPIAERAAQAGVPRLVVHPPVRMNDGPAPGGAREAGAVVHLVYLGPLTSRDMPRTLFEGCRKAILSGIPVRLTLAGNTGATAVGRRALEEALRDPVLAPHVHVAGWVDQSSMSQLLSSADAFVILREDNPENRACFPFRLAELMQSGRPVILSAVGEVSRRFRDGEDCLLIPPGHRPAELAARLGFIRDNAAVAARIGAGGARAVACQDHLVIGRSVRDFLSTL